MSIALEQAKKTLGNTKKNPAVGCVITKKNHLISVGNTSIDARPHAEQNAIVDCAKRGVSCDDCIVYVTHYPCVICTRCLLASGIKEIKYINDYKNDELVKEFCLQGDIKIQQI